MAPDCVPVVAEFAWYNLVSYITSGSNEGVDALPHSKVHNCLPFGRYVFGLCRALLVGVDVQQKAESINTAFVKSVLGHANLLGGRAMRKDCKRVIF